MCRTASGTARKSGDRAIAIDGTCPSAIGGGRETENVGDARCFGGVGHDFGIGFGVVYY